MTKPTKERIIELITDKFGKDDSMGKTCDCEYCQTRDEILEALELKRLVEERIKTIPDCWSKECMGCEWDLVRKELEAIQSKAKKVNK